MCKKFYLSILGFMYVVNGFCQVSNLTVGGGIVYAIPISNLSQRYYYKNGIGGRVVVTKDVKRFAIITGSISILIIEPKADPVKSEILSQFQVGLRSRVKKSGIFVGSEIGFAKYGNNSLLKNPKINLTAILGYSYSFKANSTLEVYPACSFIFGSLQNPVWFTTNVIYRFRIN
jgi:hypothetical protein